MVLVITQMADKCTLFFDLIRKILIAKKIGKKVILWGNGYQKREIVYIDDFIDDLILLDKETENDIVNIELMRSYQLEVLLKKYEIVDWYINLIEYDESKYVGAESKFLNTEKEKNYWRTLEPSLKDGLKKNYKLV